MRGGYEQGSVVIPMKRTMLGWCSSDRKAISALNSSMRRSSSFCLMNRFTATSTPFHLPRLKTTP